MALDRDPYDVLGVSRTASDDEIRRAYRALARTHHPDVSTEPDAEKRFSEVQEAYEVLSDAEKRAAYDRFGKAGPGGFGSGPQASPGGGWGGQQVDPSQFEDLFEQMFAGGGGGFGGASRRTARPGPRRGSDITRSLTVTFRTAALGGTEHIDLDGGGHVDLKIPAGVEEGAKLRLRGKGGAGASGGESGDLIVTVSVGGHPFFTRSGLDLLVDIPINVAEAALGTTVRVEMLKGSVVVRIPPGSSSGTKLRMRDQGIESASGDRGNLIATVQIVAPSDISDAARLNLKQLAAELPDPRTDRPGIESASGQSQA